MKKQLHKIKIAAENVVSRSSKSDRSSDDLLKADKQVDRVKDVLDKVSKKFSPNAVSTTVPTVTPEQEVTAREKRIKKVHEHRLALAIEDSLKELPDGLLRDVLEHCARLERSIASEIVANEISVETEVTRRLNQYQETHLNTIQKQKRTVTKLQQDSDSARHKYQTAIKLNESLAKISQLKEELDECECKLEKERDIWAAEMFELMAEEENIAAQVTTYVRLQQIYYQNSLREIERTMEQMDGFLKENKRRLFKVPLLDHLASTNRTIAYVIELCVCTLLEKGLNEEGLLRVGCAATKLRRMKAAIDVSIVGPALPAEYQDVHAIASLLKSYLRDLPEPLLTDKLYDAFVAASQRNTEEQRKIGILNAVNQLPSGHYFNLRYLTRFLSVLAGRSDRNKMGSQNIAIVMSPNLLWSSSQDSEADYAHHVSSTASINAIVELLVADWSYFFDGDVDFYVTLTRDDLFPDNGGFPLDRDDSVAAMSRSGGPANGTRAGGGAAAASDGVSYLQPMSQSLMGPWSTSGTVSTDMNSSFRQSAVATHSRSSSHDTSLILTNDERIKHSQSNSSLSDQSSPPQTNSPKLPVRKKHTKSVAPTPPNHHQKAASRLQPHQQVEDERKGDSVRVSNLLQERLLQENGGAKGKITNNGSSVNNNNNNHNNNISNNNNNSSSNSKPEKPPRPVMGQECCQTLNRLAYKTAKSSTSATASMASSSTPARPIALPRTVMSSSNGPKSSEEDEDGGGNNGVEVRDRYGKPAIPDRPASLMRPIQFKGSLQEVNSADSNFGGGVGGGGSVGGGSAVKKTQSFRANSTGGLNNHKDTSTNSQTQLERTHIYNVDKQQVAFIDVGGDTLMVRGGGAPIAEAESYAITTPTEPTFEFGGIGGGAGGVGGVGQVPPSPRTIQAIAMDSKGNIIKRPQVPAPPPPTSTAAAPALTSTGPGLAKSSRPKSQDSLGAGEGGGGGTDTEVTGL